MTPGNRLATFWTLAVLAIPAGTLAAGRGRLEEWSSSPEFVLLASEDEKKSWKKVGSEAEAERFVALFWARRDPDLKTFVNELKTVFDVRVGEADTLFSTPRTRGALTERGKLYILVGKPRTLRRIAGTKLRPVPVPAPGGGTVMPPPNDPGTTIGEEISIFVYEAQQLPEWSAVRSLEASFVVEQARDYLAGRSDGAVRQLEQRAREVAIRHPDLTEAPAPSETGTSGAGAGIGSTTGLDTVIRSALEEVMGREDTGYLTLVPLAGRDETALHVQLFVPPGPVAFPPETRVVILVRNQEGRDAARYDGTSSLETAAGGRFESRVLGLREGKYTVAAGVFDQAGQALATARRSVDVSAPPSGLTLGPLLVASAFAAASDPSPGEAFVFNGHRFYSKAGRLDPPDGLSFVTRIYNPAVDSSGNARISRTVKLKPPGQDAIDIPQPAEETMPSSAGAANEARPSSAGAANEARPSSAGAANEARPSSAGAQPLRSVDLAVSVIRANLGEQLRRPGRYELRVAVTDAIAKKTVEASAAFMVLGKGP